jgi:hypothetical protein
MLSQPVWDQLLETEKKKVKALEESYAEKMRSHSVSSLHAHLKSFDCTNEM